MKRKQKFNNCSFCEVQSYRCQKRQYLFTLQMQGEFVLHAIAIVYHVKNDVRPLKRTLRSLFCRQKIKVALSYLEEDEKNNDESNDASLENEEDTNDNNATGFTQYPQVKSLFNER